MASFFIFALAALCFVQFMFIMKLMSNADGLKAQVEQCLIDRQKLQDEKLLTPLKQPATPVVAVQAAVHVPPVACNTLPPTPPVASGAIARFSNSTTGTDNTVLEGVAVALLLHAPTWFQRRYSMMVQNIVNNLPPGWKVQIFNTGRGQSQAGININLGLKRMIESGQVLVTELPEAMWKIKKFQLMVHPWLWQNMKAEKVLIFGGGSAVCSNSLRTVSDFLHYDYIGPPSGFMKGLGGDGSISLRTRKHMLAAIEYELSKITDPEKRSALIQNFGQEDHFFVSRLADMNKKGLISSRLATKQESYEFGAIGNYVNQTVLVATGILDSADHEEREKFLSYCPELKLIFPSLHNPNCFGASPNAEGCAKSICALRVMVGLPRRKGGC